MGPFVVMFISGTVTFESLVLGEAASEKIVYPLHYWAGDEKSGDTKGQNVNNIWFVIDPGNFPVK